MKLTIPLKKPVATAAVVVDTPEPKTTAQWEDEMGAAATEMLAKAKPKLVLTKPKPKPKDPTPLPVISPLELKDLKEWAPRECTFCGHAYGYPCDGKAGCANHDFIVAQSKKA